MRKPKFNVIRVFCLHQHEAAEDVVRVNPNLMAENGLKRNQLAAIVNRSNGKKTYAHVAGAGEEYNLYPTTIALNYDARLRLDVKTKDTLDLIIRPASLREREAFYLFHQHCMSARRAHMYSLQSWGMALLSVALGVIGVYPLITG